ncbi:hypothetical protein [Sphingomonas sp.]|jgi:hypothetical protein|uniref:hypothetical protein n=1 Tax=Sphingomonas sp. TaxID=28214 RepID=UPI002DB8362D|nr:hypothetical protein [Sphingomonas sp.]HEU4969808.1 hypothetical protein [Sphingomonas sp.]
MRDEYDDRLHQALRHDFANNLRAIASSIAYAFDRLHERLYGAPWSERTGRTNTGQSNRFTTL